MDAPIRARVLVLAHDNLFPVNHGYRIDVLRRMQRLLDLGCEVGLICLSRERGNATGAPIADKRLAFSRCFGIDSYLNPWIAQLQSPLTPWPTTARKLRSVVLSPLLEDIAKFAPDRLLLEGLYSIDLANKIIAFSHRKLQLIYRSHNIEYQYMRGQLVAASGFKTRVNLALSVKGLEAMERRAMKAASAVLDISWDDSRYWLKSFGGKVLCLPPLPRPPMALPVRPIRWEVAYCGNLNAPNNVEAVTWFVNEVWPEVVRRNGRDMRLVLAGSRPIAAVESLARPGNGVEIVANPESMDEIYAQVRVLINPALRGSGVNIKTIDMISVGKPMVLSPAAVAGLPPEITEKLTVARNRHEWIAAFSKDLLAGASIDTQVLSAYSSLCDESYRRIFAAETNAQSVAAA